MAKEKIVYKSKRKKLSKKDLIFDLIIALILTIFVIVTLYPIWNTLVVSLNDAMDAARGKLYLWPRKWTLANFKVVGKRKGILVGAKISTLRTIVGVSLQLSTTALLSYILSRKKFVFAKQITILYVMTMYVNGGLIPTFLLLKKLHFMNGFWVYIIPGMVSAFNMLVMRTYMNGLPDSFEESAMIDGAGYFTVFVKIIVPLCKPVFATIALFIAVYQWNSWFDTMLYNRLSDKMTTLQYELVKLLDSVSSAVNPDEAAQSGVASQVTTKSVRSAATVLTSIPIICLYPFLQRYFVTGLTIGGVKE